MKARLLVLIVSVALSLGACKKDKHPETPIIPSKYTGPETAFPQLMDKWVWVYSKTPATSGPPFTGKYVMNLSEESLEVIEDDTVYYLQVLYTMENGNEPYAHFFDYETNEHASSSKFILFSNTDSFEMHVYYVKDIKLENDLVFYRD